MNTEIDPEKLKYYNDRYSYWTTTSLQQLSFTNNLLLTISIGFIAFCFKKNSTENFEFNFYYISILLMGISILYGLFVVFCRLYDFRISRRLLLARKRIYETSGEKLPDHYLGKFKTSDRFKAVLSILFLKIPEITIDQTKDYKNNETVIKETFHKLRLLSKKLGSASWLWTKFQILFLILAILMYIFSII